MVSGRRRAAAASERNEGADQAFPERLDAGGCGEPRGSDVGGLLGLGRRRSGLAGVAVARIRQVAGEIVVEGGADGEDDAVEDQPDNEPCGVPSARYGTHLSQYTVGEGGGGDD